MKNQHLYNAYKSFVLSALDLLIKKVRSGEKIPTEIKEDTYVKKKSESSKEFRTEYTSVPLFWRLIYNHEKEIKELPESIDCIKFLLNFDKIKKALPDKADKKVIKENIERTYLIPFLIYYMNKTKSLSFHKSIFDSIYQEAEYYFYSNKLNFIANAPLQNFECETGEINLENNLKIRKLTEEEFSELCRISKTGLAISLHFHEVMNIEYQIEMPYSIRKGNPISIQEPKEVFDKLISALRLFKTGIVGCNILQSKPISWQPMMGTMTSGGIFYKNFVGSKYKLTSQEVKEFTKFWKSYKKHDFNRNKFVDIAIKRFSYTHEREKAEDKLIDFMIALEALFLKEEEKAELSYRLAIRTAIFLGNNREEKEQIFLDIKDAYNLRSKIIHGSSKIKTKDLISLTSKIEEYVRTSIKKFLTMLTKKTYKEIIRNIDANLF